MSEVFFVQNIWIQKWQNSRWLPSSSWVRMNEWSFFCSKWLNPRWQNSWWLTSSSWVRMNEIESHWISLSQSFVQNSWIQDSRIHDGCHHQINQIKLVWVRVRVEWECFWVNLREDNKVYESKLAMSESKHGRIQDGCHNQAESEWMSDFFYVHMVGIYLGKCEWFLRGNTKIAESKIDKFKMADIIMLGENEWVWVRLN